MHYVSTNILTKQAVHRAGGSRLETHTFKIRVIGILNHSSEITKMFAAFARESLSPAIRINQVKIILRSDQFG